MVKRRVYLDYATTTPLDKEVERVMKPYWLKDFGNANAFHFEGVKAKKALEGARVKVARLLEAHTSEIIFTGGGTEANNLAILGHIKALQKKGRALSDMHAITTEIEHSSVKNCFAELKEQGMKVSYVSVGKDGVVRTDAVMKLLRDDTVLVSVMYANNEIGTIQPIGRIAVELKKFNEQKKGNRVVLHTDACQAPLYLQVTQSNLGADLISFDGHKLYGPKGVGALYVRNNTPVTSLYCGGEQERGIRPGTEPIPLVVGFSEAFSLAFKNRKRDFKKITAIRDYFFMRLRKEFPEVFINGDIQKRLPNNVSISVQGLNAEFAVIQLDSLGISCSSKSACLQEGESYVVKALGYNDGRERSSLRFSLGRSTTRQDIDTAVKAFIKVCKMQKI